MRLDFFTKSNTYIPAGQQQLAAHSKDFTHDGNPGPSA